MLEKDFKKIVIDALRTEGHYVEKIHGGRFNAGLPDIVACLDSGIHFSGLRGRFCVIELKFTNFSDEILTKGILGLPTALQLKNLRDAAKAGGLSIVMALGKDNSIYTQRVYHDSNVMFKVFQKGWSNQNLTRYRVILESIKELV